MIFVVRFYYVCFFRHVGLSLAVVIQTIRTVVQESRGHLVSLSFRKSFDPSDTRVIRADPANYSTESDIGINSRKATEGKLITSPYYSWHFIDVISIPSAAIDSKGHNIDVTECIMSGDIGYDFKCKSVIVGTLSRHINGGDLKLFQLCMSGCEYGNNFSSVEFSINLLTIHRIQTVCFDIIPTLQLWRDDTAASSASASASSSASLGGPHSSLFASVISYPATVDASPAQGSREIGSRNLDTCCVVTTVFMPYSCVGNSITQNFSNCELCVESKIAVVTCSLAKVFSTTTYNASSRPLNTASALNATLFNAKFGLHKDNSNSDGDDNKAGLPEDRSWICSRFRFQLLESPGELRLLQISTINKDTMSCD